VKVSYDLAHRASSLALSKKAEKITILDVRELTTVTDFFVICSGSSDTHVKTIHDAVSDGLMPEEKPWHVEGLDNLGWVLMDYVNAVIHIFQPDQRDFYSLERLWADGKSEVVKDHITAE